MSEGFDPLSVPISPAATVMLLDNRPELQVLMLRRTSKVVFAPDNWVFPGGRVDPDDHVDDFDRLCHGLSDREASRIIDVERGGLAWWLAACRETLEEAGLLLAAEPAPGVDVHQLRDRVRADEDRFVDLLLENDLVLDVSAIEEVARFITPVGSPRRFDACFFVAKAPHGQEPDHDDGEIVHWEWLQPQTAIDRWQAGAMMMMTPTVRMLACLSRYDSVDEVMRVAKKRLPYQRVRVANPDGDYQVLLPGEEGYETADLEIETGWIRLWEG
ncbi:MAG: NUDIX domain-containing protein [Actinomycetia bacterium]|nr:NUDIX domain-containing protein [Actinomycetes bacterium]MCP4226754.1 NUDIX domain-containing protein [Actinomycetes bacterium]MCP5035222.1 NUDIX domain-containing protein [Actinomycetes bacterium]